MLALSLPHSSDGELAEDSHDPPLCSPMPPWRKGQSGPRESPTFGALILWASVSSFIREGLTSDMLCGAGPRVTGKAELRPHAESSQLPLLGSPVSLSCSAEIESSGGPAALPNGHGTGEREAHPCPEP